MGIDMIRKRDGREVPFDQDKIEQAIFASFQASGSARGHETTAFNLPFLCWNGKPVPFTFSW